MLAKSGLRALAGVPLAAAAPAGCNAGDLYYTKLSQAVTSPAAWTSWLVSSARLARQRSPNCARRPIVMRKPVPARWTGTARRLASS
jgi:hypothetical protein